jgi:sugar diacid utilization regulator
MLASKLRIKKSDAEELLEFLPEQGKIYFNGSRVVIFDTTSMGKLRKDLIETLGIYRAKGFLMRHGWSCGFEAAMSIKELFQRDNKMEWIYACTKMHTITGHALVILNGEMDTGIIQSKCINSFEAEQHILNFGYYHEPVCWMLVGYASGYVTACLGTKFIFKEVECSGQGDDHCLLLGKTIEDWGEEITQELPYYEVSKISEELEEAHQKLKTQNKILERTDTIRERLAQCILNDQGAKDIAVTLAELMNCTVVLEDTHLVILSVSVPKQTDTRGLLTPYLPIMTSPSFKKSSTLHLNQKRSFQLNDQFSNVLVNRLVSPIRVCNRLFGFVSLLRPELPFTEFDSKALEQAAIILALEILKEKEIAEVEWRLKGDFIDELLSGNFSDINSIINRAFGLNYNITLPHRVLVLEIHNFSQLVKSFRQNEKKILQFKTELASTVEACLKRFGKGMVVNRSDKIIMLVQLNKLDSPEMDTRQLAENIIEQVSHRFPNVAPSIGIGSICTELTGFSHSYLCAQKAINIGKIMNKKGQVLSLEQFAAHALLFSALNPTDLYSFAANQIGSLLEYDDTNKTQLIPTLQELLNHRGNVEASARTMNMSVGGLKYRLQRIEEITGQDLRDSQTCFNLQLGLNILQLTGKDKLKSQ